LTGPRSSTGRACELASASSIRRGSAWARRRRRTATRGCWTCGVRPGSTSKLAASSARSHGPRSAALWQGGCAICRRFPVVSTGARSRSWRTARTRCRPVLLLSAIFCGLRKATMPVTWRAANTDHFATVFHCLLGWIPTGPSGIVPEEGCGQIVQRNPKPMPPFELIRRTLVQRNAIQRAGH
jgi:hypothetical protein